MAHYDCSLDDEQEDVYLRPIFESLTQQNASNEMFEHIYFHTKVTSFFKFLPTSLQSDPVFLKKCIAQDIIYLEQLPENLRNKDFINYNEYLSLLKNKKADLNDKVYPQSKEMILAVINDLNDWSIRNFLEPHFFTDKDILSSLLKRHNGLFLIPKEQANDLIKDSESLKKIIEINPKYYDILAEEDKIKTEYILLVLKNKEGLNVVKDYLYQNKDIEVALKALEIEPTISKKLNQRYWSVIKKNNAKDNAYEFLKSYCEKMKFEQEINLKPEQITSTPKVKI